MRQLTSTLLLALCIATACASDDPAGDPTLESDPGLTAAIDSAKADGAFGSREIALGATASGDVSSRSIGLFAINLSARDEIEVTVDSSEFPPSAWLYEGTERWLRPADYSVTNSNATLTFTIENAGTHHIVVRPRGESNGGNFTLSVRRAGQEPEPMSGPAFFNGCIDRAFSCALVEIEAYNGRVGAATAENVFSRCLEADAPGCENACEGEGAWLCNSMKGELPALADVSRACVTQLSRCMDECTEGDHYSTESSPLTERGAAMCWASGRFGTCQDFIERVASCGGQIPDETSASCVARCEAAGGAWDEGPFDHCADVCEDVRSAEVAILTELSGTSRAYGLYNAMVEGTEATTRGTVPGYIAEAAEQRRAVMDAELKANTSPHAEARLQDDAFLRIHDASGHTVGFVAVVFAWAPSWDVTTGTDFYFNVDGSVFTTVDWVQD